MTVSRRHSAAFFCAFIALVASGCGMKQYRAAMDAAYDRIERSHVLRTSGGSIEYTITGDGVPVLVSHGMGGGFDMAQAHVRMFMPGIKVVAPSRFGYLKTPMPDSPSVELQADLFAELLDSLRIPEAAMIGVSGGGPSALQFAIRHPDKCSHLILVSALTVPFKKPVKVPFFLRWIFRSDYLYWRALRKREKALTAFGTPDAVIKGLSDSEKAWVDDYLTNLHPTSRRSVGFLRELSICVAPEPYQSEKVSCPTLVLRAKDDTIIDSTHAAHVMERVAGARLIEFETGGHIILGHRDAIVKEVHRFLGCDPVVSTDN